MNDGLAAARFNRLVTCAEQDFMVPDAVGIPILRTDVGSDGNGLTNPQQWVEHQPDGFSMAVGRALVGEEALITRDFMPRYKLMQHVHRCIQGLPTTDTTIDDGSALWPDGRHKMVFTDPEGNAPEIETVTGYYGLPGGNQSVQLLGGKIQSFNIEVNRNDTGGAVSGSIEWHFNWLRVAQTMPGTVARSEVQRINIEGVAAYAVISTGTASGSVTGTIDNAFDQDTGTTVSAAVNNYVQKDFGATGRRKVKKIRVDVAGANTLTGFNVKTSDTGAFAGEEVTVLTSAMSIAPGRGITQTITTPTLARYIRVTFTTASAFPVTVADVRLYGGGVSVSDGTDTRRFSLGDSVSVVRGVLEDLGTIGVGNIAVTNNTTVITSINEVQRIAFANVTGPVTITAPSGGTFVITPADSAATVEAAAQAVFGAGNVNVSGSTTAAGAGDLTTGKTATGGPSPANLIDDNNATATVFGTFGSEVVVDLGAGAPAVGTVRLRVGTRGASNNGHNTIVESSVNGTFSDAVTHVNVINSTFTTDDTWYDFVLGAAVTARYWRLRLGAPPGATAGWMNEMELLGSSGSSNGFYDFTFTGGLAGLNVAPMTKTDGNVTITTTTVGSASYTGAYTLTYQDALANMDVPVLTTSTGSVTISTITPGWDGSGAAQATGPFLEPDHLRVYIAEDDADLASIDMNDLPDPVTGTGGDPHLLFNAPSSNLAMADLWHPFYPQNGLRHPTDFVPGARTTTANVAVPNDADPFSDCGFLIATQNKCIADGFWVRRAFVCGDGHEYWQDVYVSRTETASYDAPNDISLRGFPLGRQINPEGTGSLRFTVIEPN